MNKKGQFFLIAALILATILIGLGAVYVSVNTTKEDTVVYDLTREISYEASSVLARSVIVGGTQEEVRNNLTQLANYYITAYPGINLTIVYGDLTNLYLINTITSTTGSTCIGTGGECATLEFRNIDVQASTTGPYANEVEVKISENSDPVKFNIVEGQNFYIVIKKESVGETIIGTN